MGEELVDRPCDQLASLDPSSRGDLIETNDIRGRDPCNDNFLVVVRRLLRSHCADLLNGSPAGPPGDSPGPESSVERPRPACTEQKVTRTLTL